MNKEKIEKLKIKYTGDEIHGMSILQEYAERIAKKRAEEIDLRLLKWIAEKGIIKSIFGKWLFIWCNIEDFNLEQPKPDKEKNDQ